jgi:hypothetical protein
MRKNKGKREFDCIAFKRQAQSKVYEETKNLTLEDQVAYFRKRANSGSLGKWWKRLPSASLSQKRKAG